MSRQARQSLQHFNSLRLPARALHYYPVSSDAELQEAVRECPSGASTLVLGGGSNLILLGEQVEYCLHLKTRGISIIEQSAGDVTIDIAGGENWHSVVEHCLALGWYGLENLALIPGTVGAAPVQNIGAYGRELSEFLLELEYRDLETGQTHCLRRSQCHFAYRDSIFKHELAGRAVISRVRLKLSRIDTPNISYAALSHLESSAENRGSSVSAQQVFDEVVSIRSAKLPDPETLPNVGSFFKNPLVSAEQCESLLKRFPGMVNYPTTEPGTKKLAAGWLLEQSGWKGDRHGALGMHAQQALVMVNYADATGEQVLDYASAIQADIRQNFAVDLEIEPRIVYCRPA